MERILNFRVEHRLLGRLCGIVWDLAVTIFTTVLIPLACVLSAVSIVHTSRSLAVCTIPLIFVAIVSFAIGFLWNFRRHLHEG